MEEFDEGAVCGPDGCTPAALPDGKAATGTGSFLEISVVSDVICPWCYVGKRRLEKALSMLGPGCAARVTWRPFELNPDMPKEGIERRLYRMRKFGSLERSDEMDAQLRAAAAPDGIQFRHDLMKKTPNTFLAHRLLWFAARKGVQNALSEILFRAYFTQGRDIGDPATLAELASEAGLAPDEALSFLESGEGADDVRAEEEIAQRAGISGVPTFIANGYLLFSGAQRPDVIADVLNKVSSLSSPAQERKGA